MAALPVRPQVWPPAPSDIRPGRNDARVAAQKAFFEAALAGSAKPRPQMTEEAPTTPSATPTQAIRSATSIEAAAADRFPPPGSIVNILV